MGQLNAFWRGATIDEGVYPATGVGLVPQPPE